MGQPVVYVQMPDTTGPPVPPPPPTTPPLKFYWGRMLFYSALLALSGWLIFVYIPTHDPGDSAFFGGIQAHQKDDRLGLSGLELWNENKISILYIISFLIGAMALLDLLTKTVQRRGKVMYCEHCRRDVVALRARFWGWVCEDCDERI